MASGLEKVPGSEWGRMSQRDQVQELLELARDKSIEARMKLVDMIGDIFSEKETVLSDRERALMTQILEKLVGEFEMAVRRELSKRLANKPAAPSDLMAMLANDEIEVARPVLMQSRVLQDRHLVEIVRNRTRQHQLAIAVRREVSEPVSDALVETGDGDVIATLLRNDNARISEATMAYLVDQARTLDTFQEPLVGREDLGPELARKLYLFVSAALRQRILDQYDVSVEDLDDALETVSHDLAEEPAGEPAVDDAEGGSAAERLAKRIAEDRQIDAALIVKVLRGGEIALFEALFAEFSGIRPPRLEHVLYETGGKGLAVCCKALGVDKANFAPIYLLSRKGRGGEQVVDPREVSVVMQFFDRLGQDAARQVLRSWQRDPEYQDAIDALEEDRRVGTQTPR